MACKEAAKSPDNPALHDQREAQRFALILRAGKLVTDQGEFLCVLRDVSSAGLSVRLFHPLALSAQCEIELTNGERFLVEPVWQNGERAGMRFAHGPIGIHRLLKEAGQFPKRSIRIQLIHPLELVLNSNEAALSAQLQDISQHGAALQCTTRLPVGQQFELSADLLGSLAARVRWRRGDTYGLVFQQSFRLDDLARLAAQLQGQQNCSVKSIAAA